MNRIPCVYIILENRRGEVLLLLRDNKSTITFPNHWTLVGGKVEDGETPERAAHRELAEETGLKASLTFWKRYDRQHPLFIVDQHVYLGKVDALLESMVLGEGQALAFFEPAEVCRLRIGYGFKALLGDYFSMTIGDFHVHHS